MGWFSSAASWVGSKVSSAVSYASKKVSEGLSYAREKAAQACDWIAEKGEKFIDNVKETYKKIKPFLQKAQPWINKIAKKVGLKFPWVGAAIFGIGKVIDGLLALENSELAHAAEKALRGVIKFSQFIKERYLTEEEVKEAEVYEETFSEMEANDLNTEQTNAVSLAKMLNSYGLVKVGLRDVLEMGVTDFQHYLRLRATQKLLDEADHKLTTTENIDDINEDDIFLIKIAQQLLLDAEMSDEATIRLDSITQGRFGKPLIPFVFEELLLVWVDKQQDLESQWKELSSSLAKDKVLKTRLEVAKRTSELTSEETKIYEELLVKTTGQESKLQRLDNERRTMKNYVYAAEGFMQILEKDDATLEAEDKDYLITDSEEIASIIMRVAQNNLPWESLSTDEQELITDYANIFEAEGKARAALLKEEIEVGVSA
ncbi:MAG: hypothetical protein Q4P13_03485 [Psychrobacter sp.]|nr:hypothetical protein [Psychrobacter sp.]